MTSDPRLKLLENLHVMRVVSDNRGEAGLVTVSLPVPPQAPALTLQGMPSWREHLGAWPEAQGPRRQLLVADAPGGEAPPSLAIQQETNDTAAQPLPDAEAILFASCPEPDFAWDRHYLRLSWGGREIGLAMGMIVEGELHWWEGCRLSVVDEGPTCRIVEMGGAIPRDLFGAADIERWPGHENPYLHKHNWLNGLIRARLHANGVCEILAHHINSRYVDDGLALEDCIPVVGLHFAQGSNTRALPRGPLDGTQLEWNAGDLRFDMREVARLATPQEPGQLFDDTDFTIWQPYAGMSMFSGIFGRQRLGDPWLYKATDKIIPKGMARTLTFSLSLNPARSPRVARYLAPDWWYGLCQELTASAFFPVSTSAYDATCELSREWTRNAIHQGGFEDGSMPRSHRSDETQERDEAGWEGELPGAMLMTAWQSGDAIDYENALRASRLFSDLAIDHASRLVRMHGYSPPAVSLPMQRIHGTLLTWLETGDQYLLDCARSVIDNAYWLHKNSWPRMATGRDACFIRGAVLLYRYLGDDHYRQMARDAIADVMASQQPDGSFRDQGGGTGIHNWGAYITKPWMCSMAVGGMLDYLELFPDETEILASVKRLADWFMAERWFHGGAMGWSYKHFCKGGRRQYSPREGGELQLPSPGLWHLDYLARILPYISERTGDPAYFEAFAESFAATCTKRGGDHGVAQSLQYLPWLKMRLWKAHLQPDGSLAAQPAWYGPRTPEAATISTPHGPVDVEWRDGVPGSALPATLAIISAQVASVSNQ